jgi:hypothetical protein
MDFWASIGANSIPLLAIGGVITYAVIKLFLRHSIEKERIKAGIINEKSKL